MTRKPDQRAITKQQQNNAQNQKTLRNQDGTNKSEGVVVGETASPADVLRTIMTTTKDASLQANSARALAQIEAKAGYGANKPLYRMTRSELTSAIARVEALIATQGIDKLS